ncbi:MAG: HAD-IIIA family hydrolase [Planctomycetia bacterium]|nr:HAD-IIIA family hydrolase [Planctomycetia bacterium]NCG12478.1 HAD-IIIA family hydrolase [Planctomycetia bacterium]
MSSSEAVFLDRDGVINEFVLEAVRDPDQFLYYDFTSEAMARLGRLNLPVIVVTNQSAIGRGWTTHEVVNRIHENLIQNCKEWGLEISSVRYCPHHPTDGCDCRKPGIGMFKDAAVEHGIDLSESVMVGDSIVDMQAAATLGLKRLRVKTGRGLSPLPAGLEIDGHVDNLLEAVEWIESWIQNKKNQ